MLRAYHDTGGILPADYTGGDGDDRYVLRRDFSETVNMGGGDDVVIAKFGGLTAGDRIDGGAGTDRLVIEGPISDKVNFGDDTLTNFESIALAGRGDYNLKLNDHMVGAGDTFTVAVTSSAVTGVKIDGSAELDGHLNLIGSNGWDTLIGGAQADRLTGGRGNDLLTGGAGADRFIFADVGSGHGNWGSDLISDFRQGTDKVVIDSTTADAFSDLTIRDSRDGAVVSTNGHNEIFFAGLKASDLKASDFAFLQHGDSAAHSHLSVAPALDPILHHPGVIA